jgi:hypothetical protein
MRPLHRNGHPIAWFWQPIKTTRVGAGVIIAGAGKNAVVRAINKHKASTISLLLALCFGLLPLLIPIHLALKRNERSLTIAFGFETEWKVSYHCIWLWNRMKGLLPLHLALKRNERTANTLRDTSCARFNTQLVSAITAIIALTSCI